MRHVWFAALIVMGLMSCQNSRTEKTAYADMVKVTDDYQKLKDLKAEFKAKEEQFQKKYDSLNRALQIKYNDFLKRAQRMSKAKADKEYQQLMYAQQQLGLQQQQEYQKIQAEAQEKTKELLDELQKFIEDYGKQHGYTYIFSKNDFNGVLYGDEAHDITAELTGALNGGSTSSTPAAGKKETKNKTQTSK
ncbi:MAG: OmpH family outer membrane protein [Chlorobi bacterium]|nr:OmpH family outer membrane protein [Chlorobiota bacterium]